MRALSRFSHSSSNIDMIGKDENLHKKRNASKSLMSLNLESKNVNSRKHFTPDLSTVILNIYYLLTYNKYIFATLLLLIGLGGKSKHHR